MACPDENTLVAFATGTLAAAALSRVATHVEGCPECTEMVADVAQVMEEPTGPTRVTRVTGIGGSGEIPSLAMVPAGPLQRGAELGRYVVLDLLGSGGLGQVYTAYDPQLDRRVAIKLMRPAAGGGANPDAQLWLLREAQAMAQLSHPHVVPVHDVGTHEGAVFVAMEKVGGGTLRDWLKAESRSWQQIRDVLHEAGEGLAAAHAAGLVHRDFKPANVLVDEAGHAFVVDFGLARAVAALDDEGRVDPLTTSGDRLLDEDLTETGAIVGTPAYMAPEQLTGGAVDGRADQFAFCVTLWEALYGERPYQGKTLRELYGAIGEGPPAVGSGGVGPAWLRRAAARGLHGKVDARFASMDALLEAITVDRRSRRRQWVALASVAVVSAALAGGLGFWLQPEPTTEELDAVESTVAAAREAAAQACFIYPTEEEPDLPTAYARVLELEQVEGPAAEQAKAQARQLRQEFADTLVRLGDSYWDRDGGATFASDYYAAALIFDPDREQPRARVRMTPGQLGALADRAASMSFTEGELAAADALAALAESEEATRKERLLVWADREDVPVATQVQLGRLYPALRSQGAVPPDTPPAVVVADEPDEPEVVPSEGEAEAGAEPEASAGRAGRSGRGGSRKPAPAAGSSGGSQPAEASAPRDPAAAKAEVAAGRAALKKGQTGTAAGHFHRALEHDPRSTGALVGLSELHFEKGQFSQAVTYGERAVRQAPRSARVRLVLGDAYFKVLRYADARRQYAKAQDLGDGRAKARLDLLDKKTGGG